MSVFSALPFSATHAPDVTARCSLLTFNPMIWTARALCQRHPHLLPEKKSAQEIYGWHSDWCDRKANCYLYALGDASLLVPRIGDLPDTGCIAGFTPSQRRNAITVREMVDRAKRDGLIYTGDEMVLEPTTRPVALFVADFNDFHWARLDRLPDSNRQVWSHKFRCEAPIVLTHPGGALVRDPRTVSWSKEIMRPYPHVITYKFAAFFNVPDRLTMCSIVARRYCGGRTRHFLSEAEHKQLATSPRIIIPQLG